MKKGKGIVRFFSRIAKWIYHIIAISFIGKLFTSYETCDGVLHISLLWGGGRRSRVRGRHYTVRRAVACAMEQNVVSRATRGMLRTLCFTGLRTFGFFFVLMGALWLVLYGVEAFSPLSGLVSWWHLVAALVVLMVGVPLLLSDRSLGATLCQGSLLGALLFRALGITDELALAAPQKGEAHYPAAAILAFFVAALALLISPLSILAILFALLVVVTVLSVPEAGFLFAILLLPFSHLFIGWEWLTLALMVLTLAGYVGKALRGNRAFRLEWQDVSVLGLLIVFLIAGFTATGENTWGEVAVNVTLTLFYIVAVNMLATPHWLARSRVAFNLSAVVAAGVGIGQLFYAVAVTEGASLANVMQYGHVMRAGFSDYRAFAYYLVIAFAFALPMIPQTTGFRRLVATLSTLVLGGTVILSGCTGAWFAILAVLVAFLLVFEYRSLFVVLLGGGALTGTLFLLPTSVRDSFFGVFKDIGTPAISRARETVGAILSGGGKGFFHRDAAIMRILFGTGENSLSRLYPYFGELSAPFTYEGYYFWQCMLVEYGVFGIIVPAVFLFALLQNAFSVLAVAPKSKKPQLAYVGIAFVAGVLVLSFFGYVWYDKAALAAFLTASAIIASDLRYSRMRYTKVEEEMETGATAAQLEYRTSGKRAQQKREGGAV